MVLIRSSIRPAHHMTHAGVKSRRLKSIIGGIWCLQF
jgi:hypothetical protein